MKYNYLKYKNKLTKEEIKEIRKKKKKKEVQKLVMISVMSLGSGFLFVKGLQMISTEEVFVTAAKKMVLMGDENITGLIVRNEETYISPTEGELFALINEGDKVLEGFSVCGILSGEEKKMQEPNIVVEEIVAPIMNMQIQEENIEEEQPLLWRLVSEAEEVEENPEIQYKYTLRKLEAGLQRATYPTVEAREKGVVSFLVDSYEDILVPDQVMKMTYEEFLKIEESLELMHAIPVENVLEGDTVFKIITDETWGMVSFVEEEAVVDLKEGEVYPISFTYPEQIKVNMKIEKMETKEGITKLILSSEEYLAKLMPFRKVTFQTGEVYKKGIQVPEEAIVERFLFKIPAEYITTERNISRVPVLDELGGINEKVVDIAKIEKDKDSKKEWAYVMLDLARKNGLRVDDVLSKEGQTYVIDEVDTELGVYVVNGKVAEFKKVEPIMRKEDVVLIDEELSKLKELDRVIVNPRTIEEGELLVGKRLIEQKK